MKNKKKALEQIVSLLEEAMDELHEVNDNDETEKWYCTIRDTATYIQYEIDDME